MILRFAGAHMVTHEHVERDPAQKLGAVIRGFLHTHGVMQRGRNTRAAKSDVPRTGAYSASDARTLEFLRLVGGRPSEQLAW